MLEYPQYYDCFVGTGQLVDYLENEEAFRQKAILWADGDQETLELINQLTPEKVTMEHVIARNTIMQKYGYDMMVDGSDYNLAATIIFNPYYSIVDWIDYFKRDMGVYLDFFASDDFSSFSLKGRIEYQLPFYNINGDRDYQTNYLLAQEYFDSVNAPRKQLYIMKDTTHGLLESKSEEFSDILHEIARMEGQNKDSAASANTGLPQ